MNKPQTLPELIQAALGITPTSWRALSGGCIGEVYSADLPDGRRVAIKVDRSSSPRLDVEGYMLGYLAGHSELPVPAVRHSTPNLLIMDFAEGSSHFPPAAQRHAAELLAALHAVQGPAYGLERDTLIGPLRQPNPWNDSWIDFFRNHRLLAMGQEARRSGAFSKRSFERLEAFARRLDDFIEEPAAPSLLHGDVWTTNVLASGARITAFIDPAIYYGHPEIELAFTTLFGTFGEPFFQRYNELRPISPGFFEQRRDIYNLYPLLVHTRLFGGGYAQSAERILGSLGF